jgi:hypothetical protein
MSDIFKNPYFQEAKNNLSEEDKAHYARLGHFLHESVNFEDSTLINEDSMPFSGESVARIEALLRSGLLVDDLDEDEKRLMQEARGDEWTKRYR